jgi:HAAS
MDTTNKDTLVDRYLAAVSELLPAKLRKDTVTEIRSLIQDALDDRSKAEGREADDKMMEAVLMQFGSPEKIVAPYLPEKYLIGPRLFPIFILVLQIVLPIIAVLVLVASWLGSIPVTSMTAVEFVTELAKSLGNSLSAVVQAFGNIVLIFAILQWAVPEFRTLAKEKEWDPHSLKAINKPDMIKRGELITEIVFTFIALIIFNFYFDKIGIYNNLNGQWTFTPVLTEAFIPYIPWLSLLWVLTIILDILVLRKGAWQMGTRLFSILVSALNIAIATSLMRNISLLYTLEGAMGWWGSIGILKSLLNQFLILALAVTIIVSAVKIVQMILKIVRSKLSLPENTGK